MVRSFVAGLAQMAAQALAQRIVFSLFGSLGIGGPTPNANGNAFGPGGLQAFARGAAFALPGIMAFANGAAFTNRVFDNPTLFAFGNGGQFGVMGEAGPEAVMPLERGSDGRLGVRNNSGGGGGAKRFIFVRDEEEGRQYMQGRDFGEAVMFHLGQFPGRVKEILGG